VKVTISKRQWEMIGKKTGWITSSIFTSDSKSIDKYTEKIESYLKSMGIDNKFSYLDASKKDEILDIILKELPTLLVSLLESFDLVINGQIATSSKLKGGDILGGVKLLSKLMVLIGKSNKNFTKSIGTYAKNMDGIISEFESMAIKNGYDGMIGDGVVNKFQNKFESQYIKKLYILKKIEVAVHDVLKDLDSALNGVNVVSSYFTISIGATPLIKVILEIYKTTTDLTEPSYELEEEYGKYDPSEIEKHFGD